MMIYPKTALMTCVEEAMTNRSWGLCHGSRESSGLRQEGGWGGEVGRPLLS